MREYRKSKYVNFKYAKGKTDIYGRMFHNYYEVYLLLGGSVEFINDHTGLVIKPLQVVIIPPGQYHQFVVLGNVDEYERCVLDINCGLLKQDILCSVFDGKELLSFSESDRIIKNFIYLTQCINSMDESDFSYVLPAVTTDILFWIKNNTDTQKFRSENLCDLSINLMNYINEHFAERINLDLLSREFYCSVSALCHIFKKDFGISIKKYVILKRLNASHIALQKGERPEQVSLKYGFGSYSAFFRDYKKHFGVTPSKTAENR